MATDASTTAPEARSSPLEGRPADRLAVFGITGDLAKVMTFRSLYRLERRGLLDCPILGVAADDWTVDQLVERARESIVGTGEQLDEDVFRRLAARLSYVSGDFGDAATYERVAERARGREAAGLLPRDPAVPVRPGREGAGGGGADEVGPRRRREAVRPRPRLRAGARRRDAPLHRRGADLQDRPLPGEDGHRGDRPAAVRERDARADLEPRAPRLRPDHDGGGLRRRGPRSLLRSRRGAARRRRQPPHAGRLPVRDGGAGARRPQTIKDAQLALFRAVAEADPAHYVRGQYEGYRSIDGVAPDSTTETFAALRLDIENWRWSGVPFFIRTGKRLPVTQTELRLVFKHPPRLGFPGFDEVEPNQLVVKLDPLTGIRLELEAHRADGRGTIDAGHGVRRRGRRGPDPLRGAAARRPGRPEPPLHPPGRGRGDLAGHAAAAGRPPPVHPYAPGSWGPKAADELLAGFGRWYEPWIAT